MADRRTFTLTARGRAVVTVLVALVFTVGTLVVLALTSAEPSATSSAPTPTPTPTEPAPDPIDAAVTVASLDDGAVLLGDGADQAFAQALDALVVRAPVVVVGDDDPAQMLARDLQLPLLPTSTPDLPTLLDRMDTQLVLTAHARVRPLMTQPGMDATVTSTSDPNPMPDGTLDPTPSHRLDVGDREIRDVWVNGDWPDPDAIADIELTTPVQSGAVLLVPAGDPAGEHLAILAGAVGAAVVPFEGSLVDDPDAGEALRDAGDGPWAAAGTNDAWASQSMDTLAWDVDVVRAGVELPGGGYRMFPDRLFIALYGSPGVPGLGVMGQQDLEGAIERAQSVADEYVDLVDVPVVPTFEIITTIASRSAEVGGDYSRRVDHDLIIPWIEAAADAGIYVILDLQPGRTDFLTQAKEVEDLLAHPHVGLALDPEWRLLPNQVHLRQIGFVAVEEVQEVADWLAEFTRERGLPQKMLLLHQFRLSMLPNLGDLVVPPELGVAVQMDGQGSQPAKDETWRAITTLQAVPDNLWFGWKNFYREDTTLRSPADTVAVEPRPVLVSYQ
jgi:hypothetical protein